MLDAVRISGRWVSNHVLARLSARSCGENSPSRWALVKDFCVATNWRDRRGELCLSSANVALGKLEQRGLLRLPPSTKRTLRPRRRRLVDDGETLPPPPPMPASVEKVLNLRLHLVSGVEDPRHPLWNRLICREHPLGSAPLFGSQLRYVILCDGTTAGQEAVVGAFGFGPPAYHLACRDGWIGWDQASRQANLSRVIGLARFLIRPGVRCANLASRCYRLVLSRVARDWKQRYGVRPVMVETFVDRSTQSGVSLSAANWRRLGQSCGRGRSSPSPALRPKSSKDVWVYELTAKARTRLQQGAVTVVSPRSVLHGFGSPLSWTEQELDGQDLGDARLEQRFARMLAARAEKPRHSWGSSFGDAAQTKAAYRFLGNPQAGLDFANLLAAHQHQSCRRMAAESVVVLAQDTTTLSYNTLRQTRGLGPIGEFSKPGRGLLLHSLQAFRTDGIPLGCAWARVWARPANSHTELRDEQSITDKESGRWIEAYQKAAGLARSMPRTQLVVSGDRESDLFELFDQSEVAPANLHLLVRAQHDRGLETGNKLWEQLGAQPPGAWWSVLVPRRVNRPARTATLELRWCPISVAPPRVALKKSWQPVAIHAVMAREIDPPRGVEPIEWVLLTDWEVDSAKLAARMVQWYALRWGIECWHQVLKNGCGVETRQFKSARALERALVLDMIVAWRTSLLCRLAKEDPHQPASLHYTAEELRVLEAYRGRLPRWTLGAPQPPAAGVSEVPPPVRSAEAKVPALAGGHPEGELSLRQANVLVAMLDGFWGRKGDGLPGPRKLGRGLVLLAELVEFSRLIGRAPPPRPELSDDPARKPG